MLRGLFKKLVIADRLALYVDVVFGNETLPQRLHPPAGRVFYAFQVYADFSGYTDIALGMARVLGFRLTPNFRQPYLATSIKEFWARWHITLSTWLRDYLFLPLSFALSRRLRRARYFGLATERWIYAAAVMGTFVIAGGWHGAGLQFVIWGALFGAYLIVANGTSRWRRRLGRRLGLGPAAGLRRWAKQILVFGLVALAWIFFRAASVSQGLTILGKMIVRPGPLFIDSRAYLFYSFFGIFCLLWMDRKAEQAGPGAARIRLRPAWVRLASYALTIILILMIGVLDGGQFIYFQF